MEVLTFVLMAGYFVLSLLLVWYEDTSMGIHNPLQYYTALYLTYLLVCFNAVGFSLLLHIRSISANIYTSSRREITLNILCNCAFLTTRLVIEYLLLFGKPMFQRCIARTCELKGDNQPPIKLPSIQHGPRRRESRLISTITNAGRAPRAGVLPHRA